MVCPHWRVAVLLGVGTGECVCMCLILASVRSVMGRPGNETRYRVVGRSGNETRYRVHMGGMGVCHHCHRNRAGI